MDPLRRSHYRTIVAWHPSDMTTRRQSTLERARSLIETAMSHDYEAALCTGPMSAAALWYGLIYGIRRERLSQKGLPISLRIKIATLRTQFLRPAHLRTLLHKAAAYLRCIGLAMIGDKVEITRIATRLRRIFPGQRS